MGTDAGLCPENWPANPEVVDNTFTRESIMHRSHFACAASFLFLASAAPVVAQVQGPSSSQTPYLVAAPGSGVRITSIFTTGDSVNSAPDGTPYRMLGTPDGLGAFLDDDVDDELESDGQIPTGTFTLLMNHEFVAGAGTTLHAHGAVGGAFASQWSIDRQTLQVGHGQDLIQQTYLWNPPTSAYALGTTGFARFCSSTLPQRSAFYDKASKTGTKRRILMNGEENGALGRAFAHVVSGPNAGTSYELPRLGKLSFENAVPNPATGIKTLLAASDDFALPGGGELYMYLGTKQNSGTDIDKAGLTNGSLFGIAVNGIPDEDRLAGIPSGSRFSMVNHGDVSHINGAELQAMDDATNVTKFLRAEDGNWDPRNPRDYYFATTDRYDQTRDTPPGATVGRSRLYRLRFDDLSNPAAGGTIDKLLDGTEGYQQLDNMTIDRYGHVLLEEDPGAVSYLAKIWQYDIASGGLKLLAQHDPARFLPGSADFLTIDEEASGIIDASDILGPGWFLLDVQAHYANGLELVEGGQLLALYNPDSNPQFAGVAIPEPGSVVTLLTLAAACGPRRRRWTRVRGRQVSGHRRSSGGSCL